MNRPLPGAVARGHLAAGVAAALLLGCGTTGRPVQQSIWIETPECAQAACTLRNDRGEWSLPRAPGRVTVTTSASPLEVVCRAGELQSTASAASALPSSSGRGAVAGAAVGGGAAAAATAGAAAAGMAPVAAVLVLYGAVVGAGAGAAVEDSTRAIAYPERVVVPLRCATAAATAAPLGFTVRGLSDDESRRAGLPDANAALVVAVDAAGRAAAAGLQAGDLVLNANRMPVDSAARLEAIVRALAPAEALSLRVQRAGRILELELPAGTPR